VFVYFDSGLSADGLFKRHMAHGVKTSEMYCGLEQD